MMKNREEEKWKPNTEDGGSRRENQENSKRGQQDWGEQEQKEKAINKSKKMKGRIGTGTTWRKGDELKRKLRCERRIKL
jgi:hypothetical protein